MSDLTIGKSRGALFRQCGVLVVFTYLGGFSGRIMARIGKEKRLSRFGILSGNEPVPMPECYCKLAVS
jgi:hypothetical protein